MGAERLMCLASEVHLSLRGISASEAQGRFIHEALSPLPSSLNLQLHRLQRVKKEATPSAWLGVGARGIDIYEVSCLPLFLYFPSYVLRFCGEWKMTGLIDSQENQGAVKEITASFHWVHIARVCFDVSPILFVFF